VFSDTIGHVKFRLPRPLHRRRARRTPAVHRFCNSATSPASPAASTGASIRAPWPRVWSSMWRAARHRGSSGIQNTARSANPVHWSPRRSSTAA